MLSMNKAVSYPLAVTCLLLFLLLFLFFLFNLKTGRQEGLFDPFLYTYYYIKQNSNGSSGLQHTEVAQFS